MHRETQRVGFSDRVEEGNDGVVSPQVAFGSNVQPKRSVQGSKRSDWLCDCPERDGSLKQNFAFLTRCPVCGVARRNGIPVGPKGVRR